MRSLLLGCGNSRVKKVHFANSPEWEGELTTLDFNPNCGADVIFDLSILSVSYAERLCVVNRLPFDDNTFISMGAFDVLEHFGKQGDWRGFFTEMAEFHRILKPGGTFGIIVPIGEDALVDPGHTRFFHAGWFRFLDQQFYADALARNEPVTDYRWYIGNLNFNILFMEQQKDHHLAVMLQKPSGMQK